MKPELYSVRDELGTGFWWFDGSMHRFLVAFGFNLLLAFALSSYDARLAWSPSPGAASYSLFQWQSNDWHFAVATVSTGAVVSVPPGQHVFMATAIGSNGMESAASDPVTGIVRRVVMGLESSAGPGGPWTNRARFTNEFMQTNTAFLRGRLETQ